MAIIDHKFIIDFHYKLMDSGFINLEPVTEVIFIFIDNHKIVLILVVIK